MAEVCLGSPLRDHPGLAEATIFISLKACPASSTNQTYGQACVCAKLYDAPITTGGASARIEVRCHPARPWHRVSSSDMGKDLPGEAR